jgi:putative hemolysin
MRGIVTISDLVEEIVGEIFGEFEPSVERIRRNADGSALVRGDAAVRDVNRELGIDLQEAEHYSTIAGLCLDLAERIPRVGERFETRDGTTLEIVEASTRLVRSVRVRPRARPPE